MGEGSDLGIGIGCAALVAALATRASSNHLYGITSAGISEMSYTLYLVHFPIMAFFFFVFFKGSQMAPDGISGLCFFAIIALTILYSGATWWLFERNTDRVRKFIERRIGC